MKAMAMPAEKVTELQAFSGRTRHLAF
ncbi:hypothetical protein RCCS2_17031 [Roseobacter sp. CCS2]|nr:hypothetical protein RCCS2_17031 [Roseobacter sp. CCS2]